MKNYYLDETKIKSAQKILEAETETIGRAPDLVLFRKEILDSLKETKGRGKIEKLF